VTTHGAADVVWVTRGTETPFHTAAGDIGFFPCDDETHTMSMTSATGYQSYAIFIPVEQLCRVSASEGMKPAVNFSAIPVFRDTLLEASLLRLSTSPASRQVSEDIGDEVAARHVIIRLCVAVGCGEPDWQKDTSVFLPHVMREIVGRIDASLGTSMSLEDIARDVSLSPGHFARKFQQSTGLSLNRFMNRRRIGMSFAMLRDGSTPLSSVALAIGFSSQSHFTSLFHQLTGMTPQRFRQLHLRMGE